MTPEPVLIRVVLLREGEYWVAQALEFDIAAQGRDMDGARRAFLRTLSEQIDLDESNGRRPLEGIQPAPEWYVDAFEHGRPIVFDRKNQFIITPVEATKEYADSL